MDVARIYDAVADAYESAIADELDRKPFDRDLLDTLAVRAPVYLDLGCGPAHIGRYLHDRGVAPVVGVDLSARMLAIAARRNPTMRFVRADLRSLPFPGSTCPGAVAFYSLIHLAPGDVDVALAEVHRVLERGGVFACALHAGAGTVHVDDWFGTGVRAEGFLWSLDDLVTAVERAGFTIESAVRRDPLDFEGSDRLYVTATA